MVLNSDELDETMKFEIDTFNRQVITEPFNRTVLEEIAPDLNPDGEGKTLIYAVDDDHADLIVSILKDIYSEYGIDNDAVMKITGSVAGGNRKKISEAIKRFKNEDVSENRCHRRSPERLVLTCRKSPRLFSCAGSSPAFSVEQMRAVLRGLPSHRENYFEIYDPCGRV
jgi:type I restriction enzyme R subunit